MNDMKQIAETIDKISNDKLIHVIRHSNDFTWDFFAMKIILTRLNMKIALYKDDQSILPGCCDELRNLLKKSANVPHSQEDLKKILAL
jgi:hypothetical protein